MSYRLIGKRSAEACPTGEGNPTPVAIEQDKKSLRFIEFLDVEGLAQAEVFQQS